MVLVPVTSLTDEKRLSVIKVLLSDGIAGPRAQVLTWKLFFIWPSKIGRIFGRVLPPALNIMHQPTERRSLTQVTLACQPEIV